MKLRRKILCVDAGFRNMGLAVWDASKKRFVATQLFSCPPFKERYVALEHARVVRALSRRLADMIRLHQPILVVAELPTGGARNGRAATLMALAFAATVTSCALMNVKLHAVRPIEVKQWVRRYCPGPRVVPKGDVIRCVSNRFGGSLLPKAASKAEHVADAMAAFGVWQDYYERNRKSARL